MSVVEAGGAEVHHTWNIHDLLKYKPGKLLIMDGPDIMSITGIRPETRARPISNQTLYIHNQL